MELEILHTIQGIRSELLDDIMLAITTLGDMGILWIVTAILLLAVPAIGKEDAEHLKMRRMMGICMLVAMVLNLICGNLILKNLVQRPRPSWVDTSVVPLITPKDYSFPSGHTSASFAAACSIFLYHKKSGIAAFAVAGLIAFSRMYLFVHYPTDILGGMLLGIVCAFIARIIILRIVEKRVKKAE